MGAKIERPDAMKTLSILSLVYLLLLSERCACSDVQTSALGATAALDISPTPSAPGVTHSSFGLAPICPTSLPAPPQVSEANQVIRAKCRTVCLNNYLTTTSKNAFIQANYSGSPIWLIVPDSYLCSTSTGQSRNLYNQVWECTNVCQNFGFQRFICSSTCNSSCTAACPSAGVCSNYYPLSTQCRTRTCSQTLCTTGCSLYRDISTLSLPSQYALLRPPQLISVSNQTNAYRLNITSAVPKPSRQGLFFNLVVRVQLRVGSISNSTYYWLVSTEDLLDLSPFSCQNISISFAVVTYQYAVIYSSPLLFVVSPILPKSDVVISSEPIVVTSSGPIVVTSSEPIVVTSSGPNVVTSSGPNVVTSSGPNVVTSSGPNVVTSSGPNVVTSSISAVPTSLQPVALTSSDNVVTTSSDNVAMTSSDNVAMSLDIVATTSSDNVAMTSADNVAMTSLGTVTMVTPESLVLTQSIPITTTSSGPTAMATSETAVAMISSGPIAMATSEAAVAMTSLPSDAMPLTASPFPSSSPDVTNTTDTSPLLSSWTNVDLLISTAQLVLPTPLLQSSALPTPFLQSSALPTPFLQSSAPLTPPLQSSAPPTLPLQSSAPPTPLLQSSALPTPALQSSAPTTPPLRSSAPPTPPLQSTPPQQSSAPPTPPLQSSAPTTPPLQSSAPTTPPLQSSAPPTPPLQSSAPLRTASGTMSSVQPTPTIMVPTPRPQSNITVDQERDAIRKAKCHTWCISNFITLTSGNVQSYVDGPWLTIPDSFVCLQSYGKVWECRDACVNYGNWMNCSSACSTNCSLSCPQRNSCASYYTSQLQQCRARTCSSSACNVGCNRTSTSFSDTLPSQYRPLSPPQLMGTDDPYVFLVKVVTQVPSPSPAPSPLLSSLVVKVQMATGVAPPTYYWLISTDNYLNFSVFAGRTINVSFAMVSHLYGEAPVYSDPLTVWISDKNFPSQLSSFSVAIVPDTRSGYFGFLQVALSWNRSSNHSEYVESYSVTFKLNCNLNPKSFIISQVNATGFTLTASATSSTDGLKCGCGTGAGASVQVYTRPVAPGSVIPHMNLYSFPCNDLASEDDFVLHCSSVWNTTSSMFTYNFTWTLNYPPSVLTALNTATVGLRTVTQGGRGNNQGNVVYVMQGSPTPITRNQVVYSYLRDYAPNVTNRNYSFNVQLQFRSQQFPLPSLVQYCTLSALPLPLDPVPRPNVATPTTNMSVSGRQLTLLLNVQLDWTPPAVGVVMFYEAWMGTRALTPKQSDGGLAPGTVVRFKVQSSSSGKRQTQQQGSGTAALSVNFTVNLDTLSSSLLVVYIQLRTVSSYGIVSDWSPSTSLTVSLPPFLVSTMAPMTSSPSQTSLMMLSSLIPQVNPGEQAGGNDGDTLIIMIAAVVPSVAVLLVAICIVMTIICVIRSKNKVIFGEQSNLGITEGKTLQDLQDLLCEKVSFIDDWEIDPSDVVVFLDQKLGEGAFGEVYKGTVNGPCLSKNPLLPSAIKKAVCFSVAIKVLKSTAQGKEKQDFMNEIEMMKRITSGNPHIVNMIGCVTQSEPVCLMCELVTYGSLLSYLRTHQKKGAQKLSELSRVTVTTNGSVQSGEANDPAAPYLEPGSENSHLEPQEDGLGPLEVNDLIAFAYQIADGMQHLASLNIVHRDLACRNILIGENKTLKITDFGLSREVEEVYEVKGKRKLPWRWMAIESLERRIFTTYSDVWSFGITLWEISTFGGFPYPSLSNDNLLERLKIGYRMEKPENCSDEVYFVMLECWSEDPHGRPTFTHLKSKFELMLQLSATERDEPYIELSLETDQYVYIPDGIEEDDDPKRGTFSKHTLPDKVATVGGADKGGASVSAAASSGMGVANRRGIPLARMASGNPYIDSPLGADAKSAQDYETVL